MPISERLLKLALDTSDNIVLCASIVQLFIFAIPTAFYCKVMGVSFPSYAKLRLAPVSTIPFIVASAFTYFFTAIIVLYLEINLFSFSSATPLAQATASLDTLSLALSYVIVPAIAEEIFFRSIILSDYSAYKGPSAVVVSAIYFAMLHFSFPHFPLYFILGIILALLTYTTNSSIPSVIIHLINNAVVIFYGEWFNTFLKESASSVILAFILVVAFLISLATFLSTMESLYEQRSILYETGELDGARYDKASNMARAGKLTQESRVVLKNAEVFLSPTFFLSILLFILVILDII